MRKYIVGFIAGAIIVSTVQVYGGAITLIGKEIKNEVEISLLGNKLTNKAPLIDGITYVPIREVTETLGLKAVFVNGKVEITQPGLEELRISGDIDLNKKEIATAEKSISTINEQIVIYEKTINDNPGKTDWAIDPNITLASLKNNLQTFQQQLALLESELAELEAQLETIE